MLRFEPDSLRPRLAQVPSYQAGHTFANLNDGKMGSFLTSLFEVSGIRQKQILLEGQQEQPRGAGEAAQIAAVLGLAHQHRIQPLICQESPQS